MGQVAIRADDGRLTGSRGLTEQQTAIVAAFYQTGDIRQTAEDTGVSYKGVADTMRLAHVQAALYGEAKYAMASMIPLALGVLRSLMADKEAPQRIRLDATKTLLDRVGLAPLKASEAGQGDKRDLSDLSPAELSAFIQQGQDALAQAEAVTVECTPVTDQDTS